MPGQLASQLVALNLTCKRLIRDWTTFTVCSEDAPAQAGLIVRINV